MATTGKRATAKVMELLAAPAGLNAQLAELADEAPPEIQPAQMMPQNVALELVERSLPARYPAMHIYCEKLVNDQREKFRAFSGTAEMAVEVRVSQDRLEGLEDKLGMLVEAVARVLEGNRGDWGEGMFFGGGYEVSFGAVKHGGKNFVQVAKVKFEVGISR